MKVRVDGLVWLPRRDLKPELIDYFREKLVVVPKKLGDFDEDVDPKPILLYQETPTEFGVPRAWWFKNAKGDEYEYDWQFSEGEPTRLLSKIRHDGPYAEQGEAVEFLEARYGEAKTGFPSPQERGLQLGGILQGKTGFGKTNTALALFERLQTTALVIVHKEFLLKQWVNRIKKFMPGTKVGIVREDKCEFKGMDIVIAMAQSLALDDGTGARYPKELYSWPGIVALDEVHRSGAPTWAPLPMRFTSMFRLGLTATPRRKDGCDRVFWDHIGDVVFEAKTEMPEPSIRMFYIKLGNLLPQLQDRDTKSPIVINILTYSRDRTDIIVDEIAHALKSPAQRKIMVLSHRLEHLARLRARLVERPEAQGVTTDFYVGEWFTGDTIPALKKGQWKMDDEGREKAIRTIYSSLSRRKEFRGAIEKREVTEPFIGPLLEGEEKRPLVPVLNEKGNPVREKIRTVWMDASDFNNFVDKNDDYLFEESYVTNDPEEELKTKVIIDDLQDVHLFSIARDWNIKQKKTVKKKPRTDEELFEAERARVMFCTYQMCAEGIDIPAVDTMTFATPSSDVEQAIGRGRRFCIPVRHGGLMEPEDCEHFCPWRHETCEGKAQLVVSDICDKGVPIAEGREYWRRQYYRREGFKVSGS